MIARARSFARFWYDFVVGDDWRSAAGVLVALAVTYLLSRGPIPSWWVVPVAVLIVLITTLWRATRGGMRA